MFIHNTVYVCAYRREISKGNSSIGKRKIVLDNLANTIMIMVCLIVLQIVFHIQIKQFKLK